MDIPEKDHVMRHVSHSKLIRDEDGNPIGGFQPTAFELKDQEKGLSVNWLEFFKGTFQQKQEASIRKFREIRRVGKKSAYGVVQVKAILDVSVSCGADKVRVVLDEEENNKSHSLVIRMPPGNFEIAEALAVSAFSECIFDKDVK